MDFTSRWNITQIRPNPGYYNASGKAEAAVKVINNIMKKASQNGDFQMMAC